MPLTQGDPGCLAITPYFQSLQSPSLLDFDSALFSTRTCNTPSPSSLCLLPIYRVEDLGSQPPGHQEPLGLVLRNESSALLPGTWALGPGHSHPLNGKSKTVLSSVLKFVSPLADLGPLSPAPPLSPGDPAPLHSEMGTFAPLSALEPGDLKTNAVTSLPC